MIQRIQSLFLLLTTILSILFLIGTIIIFPEKADGNLSIDFYGIERMSENVVSLPFLTAILALIPILSFSAIFLFKNRKFQKKATVLLIIFIIVQFGLLIYYSYDIINTYNAQVEPGAKLSIPLIELILSILAYRGIKKDEELVRSYDRLR